MFSRSNPSFNNILFISSIIGLGPQIYEKTFAGSVESASTDSSMSHSFILLSKDKNYLSGILGILKEIKVLVNETQKQSSKHGSSFSHRITRAASVDISKTSIYRCLFHTQRSISDNRSAGIILTWQSNIE